METPEHAVVRTSPSAPWPKYAVKPKRDGWSPKWAKTPGVVSGRRELILLGWKNSISTRTVLIQALCQSPVKPGYPRCSGFCEIVPADVFPFSLRQDTSYIVTSDRYYTVALLNTVRFYALHVVSILVRNKASFYRIERVRSRLPVIRWIAFNFRLSGDSSFIHDHGNAIRRIDKSIFLAITIRVNRSLKIQLEIDRPAWQSHENAGNINGVSGEKKELAWFTRTEGFISKARLASSNQCRADALRMSALSHVYRVPKSPISVSTWRMSKN